MAIKHLFCPQCGLHRLFLRTKAGRDIYFHVGPDGKPFPTEQSKADLKDLDFTEIGCAGCSWKGPLRKLVRYFTG